MRIYLIGYMGSGKSSMGKKLASRMNYSFFDLDKVIEEVHHKTITEIFSEKGEEGFRILEHSALHQTFDKEDIIVSTGGGTPVFFDNILQMNKNGLCIYLQTEPQVLVSRLFRNQHLRPLIANLNQEELLEYIKEQLEVRSPFYEQAQMHIESKDLTPAILHNHIDRWIENQIKH